MKAVLGMLFVLAGVTVGWLVVSGKLPNANQVQYAPPGGATNTGSATAKPGVLASQPFKIQPSPGGLKVS